MVVWQVSRATPMKQYVFHIITILLVGTLLVTTRSIYTDNVKIRIHYEDQGLHGGTGNRTSMASIRRMTINKVLTDSDPRISTMFRKMVDNKVASSYPALVSLTREFMDPPASGITRKIGFQRTSKTPQAAEVHKLFEKNKVPRFYVEAGALDGVTASNTLFLEEQTNWQGLLVEMDPYFYTQILGLARTAWSINACLSPYPHPSMFQFRESATQLGQLVDPKKNGTTRLEPKLYKSTTFLHAPCLPLETMLLALNRTTVDYFSLDVEGFEMAVLKNIPFDRLNIKVLSVEYEHGDYTKNDMKAYMESQGYYVHKDIKRIDFKKQVFVFDYIFVKNEFKYKNVT